tara:strand:+ start:1884 stop:2138 length:255 start_codon:yes stop_codon:yes gene_type:complete
MVDNFVKVTHYEPKDSDNVARNEYKNDNFERPEHEDDDKLAVDLQVIQVEEVIVKYFLLFHDSHFVIPFPLIILKHNFLKFAGV